MPVLSKPEDPVSMEMKARLEELQREFEKMKQQLNQAQEQTKKYIKMISAHLFEAPQSMNLKSGS